MTNAIRKSPIMLLLCLMCTAAVSLPPAVAAEDKALASADNAFKAGDYAAAKPLYEQIFAELGAINDTPEQKATNQRVIMQLGRCCSHLEQWHDAGEWYRRVLTAYPEAREVCAEAHYEMGSAYAGEGMFNEAAKAFARVAAGFADNRSACARALLAMGKAQNRPRHYDEAIAALEQLIRDYPDNKAICREATQDFARALDSALRIKDAMRVIDEALADNGYVGSERGDLLMVKAEIELRASRYSDCKSTCQKVLADHAGDSTLVARAKWLTIQVYCEDGLHADEALVLINEMRGHPYSQTKMRQSQLDLWLGFCCWLKGENAKAEEWFTKVADNCADLPMLRGEAFYHRAVLRISDLDKLAEAQQDIELIQPTYLRHLAQGDLYFRNGDYAKAAAEYELVIQNLPLNRKPNTEPLKAFRLMNRVPNTEPVKAFSHMAECYRRLGDEAKAEDALARQAKYRAQNE